MEQPAHDNQFAALSRPLSPRTASRWHFTIRELLLLTTAVAALLALFLTYYKQSRAYTQSRWMQQVGQPGNLRAAAVRAGHTGRLDINGGGGGGGGGGIYHLSYEYRLGLPVELRGKFVAQLWADTLAKMKKEGAHVRGTSRRGPVDQPKSIGIEYEGDDSRGIVEFRTADLSEETMLLWITLYEHQVPR